MMNKTAPSIGNRNFIAGIPLIHIAYLLLILISPFVGICILLLLTLAVFLGIRFLAKDLSSKRSALFLTFSVFILLLVSAVFEYFSYQYPLYLVIGAFAVSVVGNHAAYFSEWKKERSERLGKPLKQKRFTLAQGSFFLGLRILAAFLGASWVVYWQPSEVPYNMVFFVAVIGAMTGSLFESIPSKIDSNISVPLGAGMAMWIFEELRYWVPPEKMLIALAFSFFLGSMAYKAKIADISALLSAALLGVLIIVFSGLSWFVLLLTFFILGGGFTRYKYAYKASIGIAEAKCGIRSYENVFANSMAALTLAIAHGIFPEYSLPIIYAYLGTVATATGDTLASEIGTTARVQPRMITTLKPTTPGTDGAISVLGELAAIFGSMVIGILAYLLGIVSDPVLAIGITTLGGFLGTNLDSLIGATLQKRGLLSNSGVNFVATFAGAGVSGGLYLLINTL